MSASNPSARYFTWQRFAKFLLLQAVIVGALGAFQYLRHGALNTSDYCVLLVMGWINGSYALRWRTLIRQERGGEFSLQDYRANPAKYLNGSKLRWRITVFGGVFIGLLYIFLSVFLSDVPGA